ncbi:MAG TPA: VWA domain-containing protein [Acidimicrobiales bacterium]|nr:VWA domain-containing protein [Acidimicrobiales bacterium]
MSTPDQPAPDPDGPSRRTGACDGRLPVAFVRVLRSAGLEIPGGAAVRFAEALGALGLGDERNAYWAGRATLVRRPEDVAVYDAAFRAFFFGDDWEHESAMVADIVEVAHDDPDAGSPDADSGEEPTPVRELRYSASEVLAQKDFARCSDEELAEAQRLMARIRLLGPRRVSRRRRPAARRGDWPDLRRTVREALRTDGEPIRRRWQKTGERPRRVVFLCDVSGSMSPYARALLRFLNIVVAAGPRVEAFTIGTRLTRVTRALGAHDPDAAMAAAGRAVPDWSGGTRLGDALREFNDRWGVRGLARGAVVVVLSDGWDRGDPGVLGAEMARLSRVAHRVVWVNPLKATPGYAPLVRGMAAALPYVDDFVEGHSVESLEALARLVVGDPGRAGRGSMSAA